MRVWKIIEMIFAAIGGLAASLLGGFDGILMALITVTAIDYVTGILTAIVQKKLSSAIGYRGIIRKVAMFLLVGVADLIDRSLLNLSVGGGEILRDVVICFFLINECLSIMENAALIGLPIPKSMKDLLLQLRDKMEKSRHEGEKNENNGNDENINNDD